VFISRYLIFPVLAAAWPSTLHCQGKPTATLFEVASVKVNPGCTSTGGLPHISLRTIRLQCVGLPFLIRAAYSEDRRRRVEVLGGPTWLNKIYFDITAKTDGDAPAALISGPMLKQILEERFRVQVHKEFRDTPVFRLEVAPEGLKIKRAKGDCLRLDATSAPSLKESAGKYCDTGTSVLKDKTMSISWFGMDLASFARTLTLYAGRTVIDNTGLSGRFDVHYEFVREAALGGAVFLNGQATLIDSGGPDDPAGVSFFTALRRQLGLRLVPDKSPLEVIVIDHAEKPTEN